MATTSYKQNDRLPAYSATLLVDGVAIDLTGTSVKLKMRNRATGVVKVDELAAAFNDGKVSYAWAEGDLDTVGSYDVEWEITFSDGRTTTVPSDGFDRIVVGADI